MEKTTKGVDDFYKYYKSSGGKLRRDVLKRVYNHIMLYLSRRLIGGSIRLPNFRIDTYKYKPREVSYSYINGEKVLHLNMETNGYLVAIKWRRSFCNLPNKRFFKFVACRSLKRDVSKDFRENYTKYANIKKKKCHVII